jgi:hypothetical protein
MMRVTAKIGRYVCFGSEADVTLLNFDVRFTPESGHCPTFRPFEWHTRGGVDGGARGYDDTATQTVVNGASRRCSKATGE